MTETTPKTYSGHTAEEVVELLDMLARAAYRGECNSQDEIRAIAQKGRDVLRDTIRSRAPYPFCGHPEKCIPAGRCTREIVCND